MRIGALLALTLTVPGGLAAKKPAAWAQVGPGPSAVEAAIVSDPASGTIYVATLGAGVYKSSDGGGRFEPINAGLLSLNVASLATAPGDPDLVYAGTDTGVDRSTDGGATWTATAQPQLPLALAMDPSDPDVLYAGLNGGLEKTVDGGATWFSTAAGLGDPQVFALAIDPRNTQVVYAGTSGQGAFRSDDGGTSWTPLTIDATVWSLLVDPDDSDVVYAGSNGKGVFRSTDGGHTFASAGSPEVGVVLALARSGGRLYAGTATKGVSVSDDGGATWTNTGISTGCGLVLSVDSEGTVYAGTNFDGVFRTRDHDGRGFERVAWSVLRGGNGQNGYALAIDPSDPRHVFFSTNDGGLLVTRNGGNTWSDAGTNGLDSRAPRSIAIDFQSPERVYAGSFTGGGFYKSEDGGAHWVRRLFGSAAIYVAGVDVDPVDHSVYVATFRSGDGVWKSTDFGETFTRIDRAPNAPAGVYLNLSGRGITVDPAQHETVFFSGGNGVWRSQDSGATWVRVSTAASFKVTVDRTDASVVYSNGAGGVQKSTDGGATFAPKNNGLPAGLQTSRTGALLVNPAHPATLFVGTDGGGVFRSDDAGESWSAVNDGLGDPHVYGLAMDASSPDTLYASTAAGVFKTKSGGLQSME